MTKSWWEQKTNETKRDEDFKDYINAKIEIASEIEAEPTVEEVAEKLEKDIKEVERLKSKEYPNVSFKEFVLMTGGDEDDYDFFVKITKQLLGDQENPPKGDIERWYEKIKAYNKRFVGSGNVRCIDVHCIWRWFTQNADFEDYIKYYKDTKEEMKDADVEDKEKFFDSNVIKKIINDFIKEAYIPDIEEVDYEEYITPEYMYFNNKGYTIVNTNPYKKRKGLIIEEESSET